MFLARATLAHRAQAHRIDTEAACKGYELPANEARHGQISAQAALAHVGTSAVDARWIAVRHPSVDLGL